MLDAKMRKPAPIDFWDKVWNRSDIHIVNVDHVTIEAATDPQEKLFYSLLGDITGKIILELGCGNGDLAIYMAKLGNHVVAIDYSKESIKNTIANAILNEVDHLVSAYQLDARCLSDLNHKYDFIVGKFILHHIEPFDQFAQILSRILKKGGHGIFIENNSRNPFLILCRKFLVGRFGIPKGGDKEEYPFEPREINILEKYFKVTLYYPEFKFFIMIGPYLLNNNQNMTKLLKKMDSIVFNLLPIFHKYSYVQIVDFEKP